MTSASNPAEKSPADALFDNLVWMTSEKAASAGPAVGGFPSKNALGIQKREHTYGNHQIQRR